MASTFCHFARLSAELRASTWRHALDHETMSYETPPGRQIEFYDYNPFTSTIAVAISKRYPTLFAVNREARCEAAKTKVGEWVPVYLNHVTNSGTSSINGLEICINFSTDAIYLSERFLAANVRGCWSLGMLTPEDYRLSVLSQMLDHSLFQKIEAIVISSKPPDSSNRLETNAWWKGQGLSVFYPGHLKNVIVSTAMHSDSDEPLPHNYATWLKLTLEDTLEKHWVTDGWETEFPMVGMVVTLKNRNKDMFLRRRYPSKPWTAVEPSHIDHAHLHAARILNFLR